MIRGPGLRELIPGSLWASSSNASASSHRPTLRYSPASPVSPMQRACRYRTTCGMIADQLPDHAASLFVGVDGLGSPAQLVL